MVLRVKADGTQSYEAVAKWDGALGKMVPVPIDLDTATDQVFLILYGTGLRNRSSLQSVTARVGGGDAQVLYAGAVSGFFGLDQLNLRLPPRSQTGNGQVNVALSIDGKTANTVTVTVK